MGKTAEQPPKPSPPDQGGAAVFYVQGTPEQRAKNEAALEWLRRREEQIARMSPDELTEVEREWELFKNRINDSRAGYRKLYVD